MIGVMEAKVQCYYCKTKDEKENLEVEEKISPTTGKTSRKYYHSECKRKSDIRVQQRKAFFQHIEKVYQCENCIPPAYIYRISEMGNNIGYDVLLGCYEYCKDAIDWAKGNKEFRDTVSEMSYGIAIIKNKLNDYIRDQRKKEQFKVLEKKDVAPEEREVIYKKKESKGIADFL